ncbi:cysteine-rich CWC family protein [Psychrobacillus sp.]|uniref:cysteine-rich CWC family protein n=1 Tax=Psychrobacillus sp. TaxID=1871623 RepID=UPI0028BEE00E|nr:cysteine-rich CWC family protein [Psychrobacillus sp.]
MSETISKKSCPLCGKNNKCCNNNQKDVGNCWCDNRQFPAEIFEHVPPESVHKHCICEECLDEFIDESVSNVDK